MKKLLIKLMSIGILLCSNNYAQSFNWAIGAGDFVDDYINDVTNDKYGNVYISGYLTSGTTIEDTTLNNRGAYIAKLSKKGELEWIHSFGGFDTYGYGIAIDSLNNVFMVGRYDYGFSYLGDTLDDNISSTIFLIKIDASGKVDWLKSIGTLGVNGNAYARSIAIDKENKIYIAGYYTHNYTLGDSTYLIRGRSQFDQDMIIIKLSENGDVIYARTAGSKGEEYINDLVIHDSTIYCVGRSNGYSIGFEDTTFYYDNIIYSFLLSYNINGEFQWFNAISPSTYSNSWSITVDSIGEPIVATRRDNTFVISKFDKKGYNLFDYFFNYSDGLFIQRKFDIASSNNNIYFTTGLFGPTNFEDLKFTSEGIRDAIILCLNEVGYPQWLTSATGIGNEYGYCISAINNNIYIGGDFSSSELNIGDYKLINNSGNSNYDFFITSIKDTTKNRCPDTLDFIIDHPDEFCIGDSAILKINNQFATYSLWYKDDIQLPNNNNHKELLIKTEGTYSVEINKNTRCPVSKIEIQVDKSSMKNQNTDIIINFLPEVNIESPEEIIVGDSIKIKTHYNPEYIYNWSISDVSNDYNQGENETFALWTNQVDTIKVSVEVINKSTTCIAKDSIVVTNIITGITTNNTANNVYPNPTSKFVHLDFPSTPEIIKVYDVLGNCRLQVKNTNLINLELIPSGVLLIHIYIKDKIYSYVIVKKQPI